MRREHKSIWISCPWLNLRCLRDNNYLSQQECSKFYSELKKNIKMCEPPQKNKNATRSKYEGNMKEYDTTQELFFREFADKEEK